MRIVIQRVKEASVVVDNKEISKIGSGLLLFVGFKNDDSESSLDKIIDKIINLRIFEDENNKMNLSVKDINGSILSVSQFTLYGSTKKGNRPSFEDALKYEDAEILYNKFNDKLIEKYGNIGKGMFGADMKINLINDGPVTIIMEE